MPYINIKITREGTTAEQKAELIKGATELLARVLNKNPKTTVVTIEEVDTDSWGIGGDPVEIARENEKDNEQQGHIVHCGENLVCGPVRAESPTSLEPRATPWVPCPHSLRPVRAKVKSTVCPYFCPYRA